MNAKHYGRYCSREQLPATCGPRMAMLPYLRIEGGNGGWYITDLNGEQYLNRDGNFTAEHTSHWGTWHDAYQFLTRWAKG